MAPHSVIARRVSATDYLQWIASRGEASFLQTPAWGDLKAEWGHDLLGFFAPTDDGGEEQVGGALVLYRGLPGPAARLRRSLAYVPEGPVTDWGAPTVLPVLAALRDHVRAKGAFALRIGPTAVMRTWSTPTIKDAIADESVTSLTSVAPDSTDEVGLHLETMLRRLGFLPLQGDGDEGSGGFAPGQPKFVFQVPLTGPDGAARTEDELLAGMNQLWRRNIKKAAKLGVEVSQGTVADLPDFHRIYVETAQRDHFTGRPLVYFQRMVEVMQAEDPDRIRLYLARHEGDLVAATLWVRVGTHTWYSYGASTSAKREVQGSNAIQWQMLRDALAVGARVYDMRGITDTVAADDPHIGLIRFKVGTGGQAVEYVGEWDLPLRSTLYRAFRLYLSRRG